MPNRLNNVLEEAVRLVEPSVQEIKRLHDTAHKVLRRTRSEISKGGLKAKALLGGSYAKGTWLKGEADIDIFIKFPTDLTRNRLEELCLKIGLETLKNCKPILRYAEHPYVEACVGDVRVNIVACYDVQKGSWRSAADRSPYHTNLIIDHFDEQLKRQARLLKMFMKGIGVYGAEIAVQGFSGYVCEVLALKYGSFLSVLEAVKDFQEKHILSLGKVKYGITHLFQSPIIILDPVDPKRNLGAAISVENTCKLILAARGFLKEPRIDYFRDSGMNNCLVRLKKLPLVRNIVTIVFSHSARSVDILWGQLRRSLTHLHNQIERQGFRVLRSECTSDRVGESAFTFLLTSLSLPNVAVKMGPKVFMKENVNTFLTKNRSSADLLWIGGDARIYGLRERKKISLEKILKDLLRDKVEELGIAPGLKSDLSRSFRLYFGRDVLKPAQERVWLAEAVEKLVETDRVIARIS